MVAREMRGARGTDGVLLFKVVEFVNTSQIASFFSHKSAALHHRDPDEADIQAAQEETNFSHAKQAVKPFSYNILWYMTSTTYVRWLGKMPSRALSCQCYSVFAKTWALMYDSNFGGLLFLWGGLLFHMHLVSGIGWYELIYLRCY